MQQRMEQRGGELQQRAAERERELIQPIQARVGSVIQGLRAEMNLSLILDTGATNGILAYDPALDLTARVLERLQRAQ
jgi:Skp family chaperone for outer membrane proteins